MKKGVIKLRIVNAFKCCIAFAVCSYLVSVLFSWNRVVHFKNYIYLSHPMSLSNSDRQHFIVADAEIILSNEKSCVSTERYKFSVLDKEKTSNVFPRTASLDTLAAYITPSSGNNFLVTKGEKRLRRGMESNNMQKIENAFGAIRVSSPAKVKAGGNGDESFNGADKSSFTLHKYGAMEGTSFGLWTEEKAFSVMLRTLREWEKNEYRPSIFNYEDGNTDINTYYGFSNDANAPLIIENQKSHNAKLQHILNILFAPYDISKAQYDCVVIGYGIDSTNINIQFDEGVEISEINATSMKEKDTRHIKLENMGIRYPKGMENFLYQSFTADSRGVNVDGVEMRKYILDETLFFSVKYLESNNWQWIRLFFLTTIITYLFTKVFTYFTRIFK